MRYLHEMSNLDSALSMWNMSVRRSVQLYIEYQLSSNAYPTPQYPPQSFGEGSFGFKQNWGGDNVDSDRKRVDLDLILGDYRASTFDANQLITK